MVHDLTELIARAQQLCEAPISLLVFVRSYNVGTPDTSRITVRRQGTRATVELTGDIPSDEARRLMDALYCTRKAARATEGLIP